MDPQSCEKSSTLSETKADAQQPKDEPTPETKPQESPAGVAVVKAVKSALKTDQSARMTPQTTSRMDKPTPRLSFAMPAQTLASKLRASYISSKDIRTKTALDKVMSTKAKPTNAASPKTATTKTATTNTAATKAANTNTANTKTATTKTATNKTETNKTATTKTATNKTATTKTATNKTATNKTATNKTATTKTATNKTATTKTATTKTATTKTATNKTATNKTATTKTATNKTATTKTATTKTATTKTATTNAVVTQTALTKASVIKAAVIQTAVAKAAVTKAAVTKAATTKQLTARKDTAKPAVEKATGKNASARKMIQSPSERPTPKREGKKTGKYMKKASDGDNEKTSAVAKKTTKKKRSKDAKNATEAVLVKAQSSETPSGTGQVSRIRDMTLEATSSEATSNAVSVAASSAGVPDHPLQNLEKLTEDGLQLLQVSHETADASKNETLAEATATSNRESADDTTHRTAETEAHDGSLYNKGFLVPPDDKETVNILMTKGPLMRSLSPLPTLPTLLEMDESAGPSEGNVAAALTAATSESAAEHLKMRRADDAAPSQSGQAEGKLFDLKKQFRYEIARTIVDHLLPYRADSCLVGHIQSDDDLNHLARKLAHIILSKELKYCQYVGRPLIVNESVKTKSRELITKYMATHGKVYVKSPNDPEYKSIPHTL